MRAESGDAVRLAAEGPAETPTLRVGPASDPAAAADAVLARAEAMTAEDAGILRVRVEALDDVARRLVAQGAARRVPDGVEILPGLLWQCGARWLPEPHPPFPEVHTVTEGRRHPLRPTVSPGTVYARRIPWLGRTLSFRTTTEPGDAALFSRWMNDPRVAEVWAETGSLAEHEAYLARLAVDPHQLTLFGCLDGAPFGYFELYWARESRLGTHYESEPYDRGWHVAIGEETVRGRAHLSAWLPSLMHYLFLDEPRTRRIVGEPRADHAQQLRNLAGSGFGPLATVDFPHKRAVLVALTRERFVRDRLWVPGAAVPDARPRPADVPD